VRLKLAPPRPHEKLSRARPSQTNDVSQLREVSTSSIFTDIEKQLGLKLEADRAPVDTLVIDHAEKPSEN
jgi:uncharacterized protein (TIGR03435 family)